MDHVTKNRIHNYMYCYGSDSFNQLAEVIYQKEYFIYRKILLILENYRIINENLLSITAKIESEEYRDLLEDITNKYFTKIIDGKKNEKPKIKLLVIFFLHLLSASTMAAPVFVMC